MKRGRVGIVSHDAGGAEIISSYIKRNNLECVYCLAGPAVKIFNKKIPQVKSISLKECLSNCDCLLTSMGWGGHELSALIQAKKQGKKVITFLDHWTKYKARFERKGILYLPDEIWVGDIFAHKIASTAFPNTPIVHVPNPYYADLQDRVKAMNNKHRITSGKNIRVLYICEPTAPLNDFSKSSGYTDHDALHYFLTCISKKKYSIDSVLLRPHPTETITKYQWATKSALANVTISDNEDLLSDIVKSDWVVGRSSMGLVIGLLANKKVFSCIPPNGKPCSLPHNQIIKRL